MKKYEKLFCIYCILACGFSNSSNFEKFEFHFCGNGCSNFSPCKIYAKGIVKTIK